MATPRSIKIFAAAFLAQAILLFVTGLVTSVPMREQTAEALASLGSLAGPLVLTARLAFAALVTWGVLFRASNFAKWVATVMIALRLAGAPAGLGAIAAGDWSVIPWFAALALGLLAVGCLFAPTARGWLDSKGQPGRVDATVFE
jgi:hypothetical protein